jgi:hypothetical protein
MNVIQERVNGNSTCSAPYFFVIPVGQQLILINNFHFRSLVKNCPEFIRTSMLTFFNNTAEDLGHTIQNLQDVSLTEENYLTTASMN